MKVCKLSVCKKPTLYQSVHENLSESLIHSLFLHKTMQLSPFDLQSTARCPPFYKLVTSIAFSMNYSIHSRVCNIDTMMLNFNGMIKWCDNFVRHPAYLPVNDITALQNLYKILSSPTRHTNFSSRFLLTTSHGIFV